MSIFVMFYQFDLISLHRDLYNGKTTKFFYSTVLGKLVCPELREHGAQICCAGTRECEAKTEERGNAERKSLQESAPTLEEIDELS